MAVCGVDRMTVVEVRVGRDTNVVETTAYGGAVTSRWKQRATLKVVIGQHTVHYWLPAV